MIKKNAKFKNNGFFVILSVVLKKFLFCDIIDQNIFVFICIIRKYIIIININLFIIL